MEKKRSLEFYKLLHDIEHEIGSNCYNGNIQNFGPGGVWKDQGRSFRYPVRFINVEGKPDGYRSKYPYTIVPGKVDYYILGEELYNSAHYAFGANNLYILRGLKHALEQLEKRFNVNFEDLLKSERENSEKT
jgi:hypothetical protein